VFLLVFRQFISCFRKDLLSELHGVAVWLGVCVQATGRNAESPRVDLVLSAQVLDDDSLGVQLVFEFLDLLKEILYCCVRGHEGLLDGFHHASHEAYFSGTKPV